MADPPTPPECTAAAQGAPLEEASGECAVATEAAPKEAVPEEGKEASPAAAAADAPQDDASSDGGVEVLDAPPVRVEKPIELTAEQQQALSFALAGDSFYLCGRAGTGKTMLLNMIVEKLRGQGQHVAVTAMTGAAACLLGSGQTLHSWGGLGTAEKSADDLTHKMGKNAKKRWRLTNTLIVDECSMMSSELLELLYTLAYRVRTGPVNQEERSMGITRPPAYLGKDPQFFGGLQLILVGDLHQLQPVKGMPIYRSMYFSQLSGKTALLKKVFRQSHEKTLTVLEQVRTGTLSVDSTSYLTSLQNTVLDDDKKTMLTSLRVTEEGINKAKLDALRTKCKRYVAADWGTVQGMQLSLPEELDLKIGARVMCLKNNGLPGDRRLVNGSCGTVIKWVLPRTAQYQPAFEKKEKDEVVNTKEPCPVVKWDGTDAELVVHRFDETKENESGKVVFCRSQFPLRLAWAITIHKAQGMTLSNVDVDLKGCFAVGQVYVALSRCTTLESCRVSNFHPALVKTDAEVNLFYRRAAGEVIPPPPLDPNRKRPTAFVPKKRDASTPPPPPPLPRASPPLGSAAAPAAPPAQPTQPAQPAAATPAPAGTQPAPAPPVGSFSYMTGTGSYRAAGPPFGGARGGVGGGGGGTQPVPWKARAPQESTPHSMPASSWKGAGCGVPPNANAPGGGLGGGGGRAAPSAMQARWLKCGGSENQRGGGVTTAAALFGGGRPGGGGASTQPHAGEGLKRGVPAWGAAAEASDKRQRME